MVPLPRHATVCGVPVTELIEPARLEEIIERTRNGGAEIVGLLKTGSAFYAPASGVKDMVASIIRDEHRVLPASVLLQGEYGLSEVFVGVPVRLGRGGVEEIIEVELNDAEMAALRGSAEHVRQTVETWKQLSSS